MDDTDEGPLLAAQLLHAGQCGSAGTKPTTSLQDHHFQCLRELHHGLHLDAALHTHDGVATEGEAGVLGGLPQHLWLGLHSHLPHRMSPEALCVALQLLSGAVERLRLLLCGDERCGRDHRSSTHSQQHREPERLGQRFARLSGGPSLSFGAVPQRPQQAALGFCSVGAEAAECGPSDGAPPLPLCRPWGEPFRQGCLHGHGHLWSSDELSQLLPGNLPAHPVHDRRRVQRDHARPEQVAMVLREYPRDQMQRAGSGGPHICESRPERGWHGR
mmetsp:Transcript_101487/g.140941  ORF Transcript_101487/g.140941 Transcript_101487/m.140941 type:complete len:273 (+) Transcript_101487:766-1584(+)